MTDWRAPRELPDLRRVERISLDTETKDGGLQADRGSSWPWGDGHICGISIACRQEARCCRRISRCSIPTRIVLIAPTSPAG